MLARRVQNLGVLSPDCVGMMVRTCYSNTVKVEAEGSEVHSHVLKGWYPEAAPLPGVWMGARDIFFSGLASGEMVQAFFNNPIRVPISNLNGLFGSHMQTKVEGN